MINEEKITISKEEYEQLKKSEEELRKLRIVIAEYKKTGKRLKESRELFNSMVNSLQEGILIIDWKGKILFANKAMAEMAEFKSAQEGIGLNALDFVHPKYKTSVLKDLALVKLGKGGFLNTYIIITGKGNEKWVECLGTKIVFQGKTCNLVMIRDVAKRKEAEQELKKRNIELEEFNKIATGRELKMIELKKEIKELKEKLNEQINH